MRTPVCAALLAAVLVLAGCVPAERATGTPSASPSTGPSTLRYALTPQVCSQIDFDGLKAVIPLPLVEEVSTTWFVPANFLYTGGVQCLRTYGAGKRPAVMVAVGMATYESPEGARLAYDTRLVKETAAGSLPGVELMSHAHNHTDDTLYVRDGNLFVEVTVSPFGEDRTFAQVGVGGDAAPAVESFAGELVERLRDGHGA